MNNNSNKYKYIIGSVLVFAALPVQAINVAQNASVTLKGTTVVAEPQLAGTVLVDEAIPFSYEGISGSIQQRVVRSSVDSTIDFYWRITNDKSSKGNISQFIYNEKEATDYGVTYNVDWRVDAIAGDIAPEKVTRFGYSVLARGGAQFDFFSSDADAGNGIKPGQTSKLFFIDTNKTSYTKTGESRLSSIFKGSSTVFESYKVGKDSDTTPTTNDCIAIYKNGVLSLPCVDVSDGSGGLIKYEATLKLLPNPNATQFEVTGGKQK